MAEEYTLDDLEKLSGLPMRTLRFYIQEGLLPGPDTRGKFARYSGRHLVALKFIQHLKSMRLPLQQIRQHLQGLSTEDMQEILMAPTTGSTNLNYNLLREDILGSINKDKTDEVAGNFNPNNFKESFLLRENTPLIYNTPTLARSPKPQSQPVQKADRQVEETWQRIRLADGIELQIRKPVDKTTFQLVDELRSIAYRFFETGSLKEENEQDF